MVLIREAMVVYGIIYVVCVDGLLIEGRLLWNEKTKN